jgi:hypothetical protein
MQQLEFSEIAKLFGQEVLGGISQSTLGILPIKIY